MANRDKKHQMVNCAAPNSRALHMVELRTMLRCFTIPSVPGRSSRSIFRRRGSLSLVIHNRDSAPRRTVWDRPARTFHMVQNLWEYHSSLRWKKTTVTCCEMKSRLFLSDDCFYSLANWGQSTTRVPFETLALGIYWARWYGLVSSNVRL